ncbi:MAG: hypothetical protein ABI862_19590 [Ilumatobacteraceae bacterium]
MRVFRALLVTTVVFAAVAPRADAAGDRSGRLGRLLGDLWEAVIETPAPENVFNGGNPCIELHGKVVVPFAPLGVDAVACSIERGTSIFVVGESSECSTVEAPPFFGPNERELRECARDADDGFAVPRVTLDGNPIRVQEVESDLITLRLPAVNIFGIPAQKASSVAHGWVALLRPLSRGTHTLEIRVVGTDAFGNPIDVTNVTTITVRPGR